MLHNFELIYKERWSEAVAKNHRVIVYGKCKKCGLKIRLSSYPVGKPYSLLGVSIFHGNYKNCI